VLKISFVLSHDKPEPTIHELRARTLGLGFSLVGDVDGTTEQFLFRASQGGSNPLTIALNRDGSETPGSINVPARGDSFLFLGRYISIISVLDTAASLGCRVQVFDEGGYWEHRSIQKVIAFKEKVEMLPDPREILPFM